MNRKPRIAVAGFQHESNSFSPFGATWHDFEIADGWPQLTTGEALLDVFPPLNIPLGGFLSVGDFEFVPIAWSSAEPSGPVSDDAFARMSQIICDGLRKARPLDGVYLDLHGAMVTDSHEDGEGELLTRIRGIVGDAVPVVVSLDMHANITEAMVALTDAMTIYRTYPHVDMANAGARCAPLMASRLAGLKIFKAFRKLPYLIPLSAQCTDMEPFRSIYRRLPTYVQGSVLSADIASGFPAADIRECGPSIIAYALDQASADKCADEILSLLLEAESAFRNELVSVKDAIATAMADRSGRPVVLADVQDNPGAGGTSDTTTILRALVGAGASRAAVSVLWDPEAARMAHDASEGAEIELQLGGRYGYDAAPFRARFHVERISDGHIKGDGAIVGGAMMSLGAMAQLRVSNTDVRVVVSSIRYQCLDQMLFRALGVEPRDQAILVVKSTIHFRADFESIASRILLVDSPGAHACRLNLSNYRRLRPGLRVVG
ncbi:MAG TPA: M81 family metallopeptidase [Rhizomicrobium sp.]|nr:M81 family metallopeptidase [Rhizomicrobium sp.]